MRILILALSFVLTLASEANALRQGSGSTPSEPNGSRGGQEAAAAQKPSDATTKPAEPTVNADDLGVSIDRIRLKFKRDPVFENVFDPGKLRLITYVEVVAKAPPIRLFGPDARKELTSRAVPFGAPTHQDMLQIMTPQEFRTPPMDLTAIINWLAQRLGKKSDEE